MRHIETPSTGHSKAGMAPRTPSRLFRRNREPCWQVGFLEEVRLELESKHYMLGWGFWVKSLQQEYIVVLAGVEGRKIGTVSESWWRPMFFKHFNLFLAMASFLKETFLRICQPAKNGTALSSQRPSYPWVTPHSQELMELPAWTSSTSFLDQWGNWGTYNRRDMLSGAEADKNWGLSPLPSLGLLSANFTTTRMGPDWRDLQPGQAV